LSKLIYYDLVKKIPSCASAHEECTRKEEFIKARSGGILLCNLCANGYTMERAELYAHGQNFKDAIENLKSRNLKYEIVEP